MMRSLVLGTFILSLSVTGTGCGDDGSAGDDAGMADAGPDSGGERDSGSDAGGSDAGIDSAVADAGRDTGAGDAAVDSGSGDAGPVDAGPPTLCTLACESHGDCGGGFQCLEGRCRRYQCADDSSCFGTFTGEVCAIIYGESVCREACETDEDCDSSGGTCDGVDDMGRGYCTGSCNSSCGLGGIGGTCREDLAVCTCTSPSNGCRTDWLCEAATRSGSGTDGGVDGGVDGGGDGGVDGG